MAALGCPKTVSKFMSYHAQIPLQPCSDDLALSALWL